MAKSGSVWGIDLGQCVLKALRCRAGGESGRIVAEAFDFIEYPKILSQPEANPVELIKEALELFLSRNSVKGDRVAISVSGQSGLARFIKLPPVETKKIPDIVKYEARQQIPFALEDVVWDYQQMAGGSVEEGFALEAEVGLFAMKRDQVYRALRPFTEAGIEVEVVQLTPVALYNFATFDQMPDIPPPEQYTADDPPPSTIVLSLGADMSDLVVSNGYRVWQRTINLGGNHFTKALTKQMKLTFAKAEHLKRNAMKAEDPKAVFQAMRPVFGELKDEVQRSLSFFQNLDRTAKLGRIVALGNAMKLRGLHKYLEQNLGLKVVELDGYRQLDGTTVTASPAFKDNMLSFGVCYGLAVQALGQGRLSTNLLPREIIKDRMIRAKKPWAVAAVAVLLLGYTGGYLGKWREWESARPNDAYQQAFSSSTEATGKANQTKTDYETAKTQYDAMRAIGQRLAGMGERRMVWAELLKVVNECLPRDEAGKTPKDISERNVIYIDSIDCEYQPDLTAWLQKAKEISEGRPGAAAAAPGTDPAAAPPTAVVALPPTPTPTETAPADPSAPPPAAPSGNAGWVIQIIGHHYHNKGQTETEARYLHNTLLKQLKEKADIILADVDEQGLPIKLSTKDLGIELPIMTSTQTSTIPEPIQDPNISQTGTTPPGGPGVPAAAAAPALPKIHDLLRFPFKVQFAWKPTPRSQREAIRAMRIEEERKQKAAEPEQPKVAAAGE